MLKMGVCEMSIKCNFNYSDWCNRQAEEIVKVMRNPRTSPDAAFFLIPCTDTEEGKLVLANDYPPGMPECVHFRGHRTWRTIPYSHVSALVFATCGSYPIIPANAWSDNKAA